MIEIRKNLTKRNLVMFMKIFRMQTKNSNEMEVKIKVLFMYGYKSYYLSLYLLAICKPHFVKTYPLTMITGNKRSNFRLYMC